MNRRGDFKPFRLEDQEDFIQAPVIADVYQDVEEAILTKRRVPCICPEQENGAKGCTIAFSTTRRILRERVRCDRCPRTWIRVNCR